MIQKPSLRKAIRGILNPAPGIRLSGMKLMCGCRQERQADDTWRTTEVGDGCTMHKAPADPQAETSEP